MGNIKKSILFTLVVVLVLITAGFLIFYSNRLTNRDYVEKQIGFVEAMGNADSGGIYSSYMSCDGNIKTNELTFAHTAWSLLAFASMYDATGEEKFANEVKNYEKKLYSIYDSLEYFDTQSLVMYDVIYKSYQLLKGKSILSDEGKLRNIILRDTQIIADSPEMSFSFLHDVGYAFPQDVLMRSASYSAAAKILNEQKTNLTQIKNLLDTSEAFYNKGIEVSKSPKEKKDGVICWLTYAQYNLESAQGKDTQHFESTLLDPKFKENLLKTELPTANSLQPCMDVMYNLYLERHNSAILKEFQKYNDLLKKETLNKNNNCNSTVKYALQNLYYEDAYYLSDNAYQTYLMTRPEIYGVFK